MFLIPYDECGEWMLELNSVLSMHTLVSAVFTEEGVKIEIELDLDLDPYDENLEEDDYEL
jgi:hypothetical protein